MSSPFVAEIRIFPCNFAPLGWAWCDGQLLPLSQNTALFSLLGTNYGGNGTSNFGLPDLQGRAAMHTGRTQGAGLSLHDLGEQGGVESVQLLQTEIPSHTHTLKSSVEDGTQGTLSNGVTLSTSVGGSLYQTTTNANLATMSPQSVQFAGSDNPHNNMQPYLTLYFCIALQGVFPARN
jgi:microcystin-dependent protein